MTLTQLLKNILRKLGCSATQNYVEETYSPDVPASLVEIYKKVKPYTMTSPERVFALCEAVKYIHEKNIEGSIVECGVWKGGSMMAVAETLLRSGDTSRNLYLFDTFDGMSPPTDEDVDIAGVAADSLLERSDKTKDESVWCCASLEVVKTAVKSVGYPSDKIHLVKGMVEQTIPLNAPDKIALLRLDTDWYESTKHEMEHLFPRLAKGGVLIIDDYGHWQGARKAVNEYLENNNVKILLNRIDYTGRIAVKVE
jgi:O-methyltransferase